MQAFICALVCLLETSGVSLLASDIPIGPSGFTSRVVPFFKESCITCHGPEKSKGKITLHTLDGGLKGGHHVEQWEKILEALKSGEMPPEDEPQPNKADRLAVVQWIESELRQYVEATNGQAEHTATTRRLTNFEYQNTMRDLFGFELKLSEKLHERRQPNE